jgi:hypothetical protein
VIDRSGVDRVLAANRYLVLGTADEHGQPWATPVFFAPLDPTRSAGRVPLPPRALTSARQPVRSTASFRMSIRATVPHRRWTAALMRRRWRGSGAASYLLKVIDRSAPQGGAAGAVLGWSPSSGSQRLLSPVSIR